MSTTPNYNLTVYAADDLTTKFYTYRTETSGDTGSSNFMIIDSVLKDLSDDIQSINDSPNITQINGSGTNDYTATVEGFTYISGQSIILSVDESNTGAATLNINSLGIRPLMKYNIEGNMVQLDANDLIANNPYLFVNRNNNWILMNDNFIDIVQETGDSTNSVMSQKAVTDALASINNNTLQYRGTLPANTDVFNDEIGCGVWKLAGTSPNYQNVPSQTGVLMRFGDDAGGRMAQIFINTQNNAWYYSSKHSGTWCDWLLESAIQTSAGKMSTLVYMSNNLIKKGNLCSIDLQVYYEPQTNGIPNNGDIATIPVGYRPSSQKLLSGFSRKMNSTTWDWCNYRVNTNGVIKVNTMDGGSTRECYINGSWVI